MEINIVEQSFHIVFDCTFVPVATKGRFRLYSWHSRCHDRRSSNLVLEIIGAEVEVIEITLGHMFHLLIKN